MYAQVAGYLEEMEDRSFADQEMPVLLTAVQAHMAETLTRTGSEDRGLALARRLVTTRDFPETASTVESHLFSIISSYAVDRAERADYPGARLAFSALEFQCLQNRICNSGLAQVYSANTYCWTPAAIFPGTSHRTWSGSTLTGPPARNGTASGKPPWPC